MKKIFGTPISDGIAIGKLQLINDHELNLNFNTKKFRATEIEISDLTQAIDQSVKELKQLQKLSAQKDEKNLLNAHLLILQDPEIIENIKNEIIVNQKNVYEAIQSVIKQQEEIFVNLKDEYFKQRISDIKDVISLITRKLLNLNDQVINEELTPFILGCREILPSQIMKINKQKLLGVICETGSYTSHSAILLRNLKIPALFGVNKIYEYFNGDDLIIIESDYQLNIGTIIVNPDAVTQKRFELKRKSLLQKVSELNQFFKFKTETLDHRQIKLYVNLNHCQEKILNNLHENYDFDGIGLFRSEFIFTEKESWPSEEEQFQIYRKVLTTFSDKEVTIRTLDIGGDKNLPYFSFLRELNPFLGVRSIRFSLTYPDIFKQQIRALLRASVYGKLAIMFPLISVVEEVMQTMNLISE
jgi:phosphotransferase system enzyme I (PtsI)